MASGEGLHNTVGRINAITCEASSHCLHPEILYLTLQHLGVEARELLNVQTSMHQPVGC